jgi:hypothetical protein
MYNSKLPQVELDLLRTLPNNRFYEHEFADNIVRLRRVLLAFAAHNTEVAYCQVGHLLPGPSHLRPLLTRIKLYSTLV